MFSQTLNAVDSLSLKFCKTTTSNLITERARPQTSCYLSENYLQKFVTLLTWFVLNTIMSVSVTFNRKKETNQLKTALKSFQSSARITNVKMGKFVDSFVCYMPQKFWRDFLSLSPLLCVRFSSCHYQKQPY